MDFVYITVSHAECLDVVRRESGLLSHGLAVRGNLACRPLLLSAWDWVEIVEKTLLEIVQTLFKGWFVETLASG